MSFSNKRLLFIYNKQYQLLQKRLFSASLNCLQNSNSSKPPRINSSSSSSSDSNERLKAVFGLKKSTSDSLDGQLETDVNTESPQTSDNNNSDSISKSNHPRIGRLLARIFNPKPNVSESLIQNRRRADLADKLKSLQVESDEPISVTTLSPDLVNSATNVLYWHIIDLSFEKSDFERILPPKSMRIGVYNPSLDNIDFTVSRSRDPDNLTRWFGYYLTFESKEAALMYYQETIGADICGLQVNLSFVNPLQAKGLSSPILDKAKGVIESRRCCVLLIGLPPYFSQWQILKSLWDYDFVDSDDLAVEMLPMGKIKYGGRPYLLRFKNEDEARRLVRDLNGMIFPNTNQQVFVELID